jgi:predicted TIM-barrel fold metal-dependent hydrolase
MNQRTRTDPVIVVSSDCHIGPRLVDDLRPYCPAARLDDFDDFVAHTEKLRADIYARMPGRNAPAFTRNQRIPGHYESDARLRDLDRDGVAAEVIFHGSQNEEPIPFGTFVVFIDPTTTSDPELVAVGRHIYNEWLADFCSAAPARRVGLAQLPMWDVERAVREVEWAHERGLRGVNFPAPRPGAPMYNDRSWDPFWSVCAERRMVLTCHSGAGDPDAWTGPEATALMSIESGGWFSRRALHQMIFGGVFERHPDLQLVLTEQPGDWWPYTLRELDSAWMAHSHAFRDQVPRLPSEYCARNVAIGSSFLAHFEAEAAVRDGYADKIMWGSDYPHMEGTYQRPHHDDDPSMSVLAMRHTFAGLGDEAIRAMAGENAVRVYGLDHDELTQVAHRIGAPTVLELSTPIAEIPPDGGSLAFRTFGPWA